MTINKDFHMKIWEAEFFDCGGSEGNPCTNNEHPWYHRVNPKTAEKKYKLNLDELDKKSVVILRRATWTCCKCNSLELNPYVAHICICEGCDHGMCNDCTITHHHTVQSLDNSPIRPNMEGVQTCDTFLDKLHSEGERDMNEIAKKWAEHRNEMRVRYGGDWTCHNCNWENGKETWTVGAVDPLCEGCQMSICTCYRVCDENAPKDGPHGEHCCLTPTTDAVSTFGYDDRGYGYSAYFPGL